MPGPSDGSIEFTVRRLSRWFDLPSARTARIDYLSDLARAEVLRQLGPRVLDVVLDPRMPPARQADRMLSTLNSPVESAPAVISFTGFDQAFPEDVLWADAMQVLNVNRENFAHSPRKQIWWIQQRLLGTFVRSAPDLDSWFDLKLSLTEIVTPPARTDSPTVWREPRSASLMPSEARESAHALLERARTALAAGEDPATIHKELLAPAIRQLLAASLVTEAMDVEREFGLQQDGRPARSNTVWNIPASVSHFTGRQVLLASIAARLASSGLVVLNGPGGVGKTQSALRYAQLHRDIYSIGWLVRAANSITLGTDFAGLAAALDLPEAAAQDQSLAIRAALDRLRAPAWEKPWLLILEDAGSPEVVSPYLVPEAHGHILITSRDTAWRSHGEPLQVGLSTREESVQFLLSRTAAAGNQRAAAAAIAAQLGDLPLALEQAAAYVAASHLSLQDYERLLSASDPHSTKDRTLAPGLSPAATAAWDLSCRRLQADAPESLALLEEFAFLDPDDIPIDLLISGDPDSRERLIEPLLRHSLVSRNGNLVSVPRLVQSLIRQNLRTCSPDPQIFTARLAVALSHVNSAFPFKPDEPATWSPSEAVLPHALAVVGYAESDRVELDACSLLLNQVGLYLRNRARLPEARQALERALSLAEQIYGSDHHQVSIRANNLSLALHELGDLPAARALAERALRIDEKVYGEAHHEVAIRANNLGVILQDLGDLPAARQLIERALRIDEQVYGRDDARVAADASNLALILEQLGDLPSARALTERALHIDEQVYGTDHPSVAIDANNLGSILHSLGDLPAAQALTERALRIAEHVYGPDHLRVSIYASNLAQILKDLGDLPAARALIDRAFHINQTTFGPDHPKTRAIEASLRALDNP